MAMKVLIVQTSFLGDVVLSTPVISALKRKFPTADLYALTTPIAKELVNRDPLLAGVLTYDKHNRERSFSALLNKAKELRKYKFDMAYALQRSFRTALLLKLAGIRNIIGFDKAGFFTKLFYTRVRHRPSELHDVLRNLSIVCDGDPKEFQDTSMRLFAPNKDEVSYEVSSIVEKYPNYIVIAPGSAWETKRWSEEGYQEVFDVLLKSNKYVPLVVGNMAEREIASYVSQVRPEFNLAGKLSISETMFLVSRAKAIICNDSMMLHLGSAFKIPTVVIFCATSPSFGFGPWQNKAKVVEYINLKCKPCARHGTHTCPNGTNDCMKKVSSFDVLSALQEIMGEDIK